MDAATLQPDSPLPDDVTALQAMVRQLLAEVARLRQENAELRVRLDAALKHRFGRRSERRKPEARPKKGEAQEGKATPHGRAAQPLGDRPDLLGARPSGSVAPVAPRPGRIPDRRRSS